MDMSPFVVPKSDQINADDLISGPKTIRITRVSGTNNADQPVAVYFDGDDEKPFKPCKSMRRVMIAAWGVDAAKYVGRSMTLYRDPKVAFGGMEVGGIRISAMSHIDKPLAMALTVTKAKRAPYRVSVLNAPVSDVAQTDAPPMGDDGKTPLNLAAIKEMYETYRAKQDRDGLKAWIGALAPDAQTYVRDLMAEDKKAAA